MSRSKKMVEVHIAYDDTARVWFVQESDMPGLSAEAPTVEALIKRLPGLITDLVECGSVHPVCVNPGRLSITFRQGTCVCACVSGEGHEMKTALQDGMVAYFNTPETKGETEIKNLDVPYRVVNALKQNGFRYVSEVEGMSDHDLMMLPGIWRTSVAQLRHALLEWGAARLA
jgi:hypothetical protein